MKLYAVQWYNRELGKWEVCQSFEDVKGEFRRIACIYFSKEVAEAALVGWVSYSTPDYRVARVKIKDKE